MSANKNTQNFGRQAPIEVAKSSTRTWLKRGAVLGMAAAALIQSPTKVEAKDIDPLQSPVAAERIDAEIAAIERAYEGRLDILNMQQERYTDAVGGLFDADGPDAHEAEPVELFYHPDIPRIEQDLMEAFEQAGSFNLAPGKQYRPTAEYFPGGVIPEQAEEINTQLAQHFSRIYTGSLISPNPANGSAMVLDFQNEVNGEEERRRVCLTILTPSITDEDTFMGGFTRLNTRGIDLELADLYQFVANHEFAHCMNTNSGMPLWFNETMSDAYALTRHMQLNGDDGFAETVLSMRQLNGTMGQDLDHYTVPGLDRILPKIREAYANGELEGLDPKQLRDLTIEMMLGENEQEIQANGRSLMAAQSEAGLLLGSIPHHVEGQEGQLVFKESVPEELRTRLEPMLGRTNAAIAHLSRPNAMLEAAELNSSEAERDYRANLDEYVATQPSAEVARDGMRVRLYGINRIRDAFIEQNGIENVAQFDNAFDGSKLTMSRQLEIIEEYEQNLSPERLVTQDQTTELGRDVG